MVKVKICGITNLNDAQVSIEAGAYALGFNFYKRSPRYIDPHAVRTIVNQLPSNVLKVGVFVNESKPEDVAWIADESGVDAIQLHGDESPDYCAALRDRYVIKVLHVTSTFSPASALEYETQAILLDAFSGEVYGGSGQTADWTRARETRELVPKLYLAGGLSPENVADAINSVRPFAVDACSRLESSPGVKDATRVQDFLASVKNAR
jgi:phosphoribosylanthranilate isomerase